MNTIPIETELAVLRLNSRYAMCLDDDRLEEWPAFFTDTPRYMIQPRENFDAGLDGYWIYFDSQGMLQDRITSLRGANLYNIHRDRRIISNVLVESIDGNRVTARASFAIIQSDVEGRGKLFMAGEFRDRIVFTDRGPLFEERLVLPDTFNVDGLVAIPL